MTEVNCDAPVSVCLNIACFCRHIFKQFYAWHGYLIGFVDGIITIHLERVSRYQYINHCLKLDEVSGVLECLDKEYMNLLWDLSFKYYCT